MTEKLSLYLSHYGVQAGLSLIYIAVLSLTGFSLTLRRSGLYGLILASVAQFAFILALFLHLGGHGTALDLVSRTVEDLHHLDLYIFALTMALALPFIFLLSRGISHSETALALILVFFMGITPLANALMEEWTLSLRA